MRSSASTSLFFSTHTEAMSYLFKTKTKGNFHFAGCKNTVKSLWMSKLLWVVNIFQPLIVQLQTNTKQNRISH